MRESFIFYLSFAEALEELPEKSRLKIYDAIIGYALRGKDTEFKGIEKAVFSLIKPQIEANNQRYKNGCLGGRPKSNQTETEIKPKDNQTETKGFKKSKTKTKPNGNQNETKRKPNENVNENVNENDTPLLSPHSGERGGFQEKFFSVYCQFKKFAGGEYPQIDFEKLLTEFEKSSTLRKTFSWQVILDGYDSIMQGNFRDKTDGQAEGREYMADRERYYTTIRNAAERKAESIRKRFMQNDRYAEIDRRLRVIPIDQGKAEAKGDKSKLAKLEQELSRLKLERCRIIEMNGLTEEDIEPRITCAKCQDTGFDENGALCDCYKGD